AHEGQEQKAYPRPITVTASLIDAGLAIIERGAAVADKPNTAAELTLFACAVGRRNKFRPANWQTIITKAMNHPLPFVRAVAVENLPKPLPKSLYDALLPQIADDFPPVAVAALN
ncbi:MAG: hypothetical protein IH991_19310, partial [Planctomycetes bacterium]|nr:hypothetical protein [Planctomycetota bacterium]